MLIECEDHRNIVGTFNWEFSIELTVKTFCIQEMLFIALVVCMPVFAVCQVDIDALANSQFNRYDVDQDGSIEPLEIQQYYGRFDANHDQRISRLEYHVEVDTHHVTYPQTLDVLLRLFDALDYDNDNHIDGPDYVIMFSTADANKNNLVTQREFVVFFYDLTGYPLVG
ncbi:hypothetical protein Btru_070220 [Bulinus truncatus]|nr:hypothetical protein Btru_070220 [Bulinus truncatus]